MLREGHHHEWTILSIRVAAYLTSQSLFASGAATVYVSFHDKPDFKSALLFFPIVGLMLTILSSISITINLRVLRDWHILITNFLKEDRTVGSDETGTILKGHYLPRNQPDLRHTISVDLYCFILTMIVGAAWAVAIINVIPGSFTNGTAIHWFELIFFMWIFSIVIIYSCWSLVKNTKK